MNTPVIKVENLCKEYVIGRREKANETFRDLFGSFLASPWRRFRKLSGQVGAEERFWALRDVSFEVNEGDVVGIIGRNGAGKSTLLKILSRITAPTQGRVEIRGRVASLLEVGTGFHPELTGRENIYLNGAILGMSRAEISHKLDEIIAFAELEKFIDTPVKRYSSGMYVRLAFSVAAHLDSDILIVDEVLAVGDSAFQRKCLGSMEIAARRGRTVILVSHNLDILRKLCSQGILLTKGLLDCNAEIGTAIEEYSLSEPTKGSSTISFERQIKDEYFIDRIEILSADGGKLIRVRTWDEVVFRIHFHAPRRVERGSVVLQISTSSGAVLTLCSTEPDSVFPIKFEMGKNCIDCRFPQLMLSAGRYRIGAGLAIPNLEWLYRNMEGGVLVVEERDVFNAGRAPQNSRYLVPMHHHWEMVPQTGRVRKELPPQLDSGRPTVC